jgi:ubiquitin-protein ligase
MDISIKRILKDINDLEKTNLNSHGIYHYIYDDDIYNMKVLMIGPSNTPYEFGFYFFNIVMPNDYPFSPPKVTYCTQNGKTRFNPNLYVNGKVCLSIINTWNGPRWTSCNSISTILLSIQALVFVENPLQNEPGYEKETGIKNDNYNNLLLYENFRTAIHKMILTPPPTFEEFNSITIKYFIDNYQNIIDKIDKNITKNNKCFNLAFYNMSCKLNYIEVKESIISLYNNIINNN